jgi:hypothetical protein
MSLSRTSLSLRNASWTFFDCLLDPTCSCLCGWVGVVMFNTAQSSCSVQSTRAQSGSSVSYDQPGPCSNVQNNISKERAIPMLNHSLDTAFHDVINNNIRNTEHQVAIFTANTHQGQCTKSLPNIGITDNELVILSILALYSGYPHQLQLTDRITW